MPTIPTRTTPAWLAAIVAAPLLAPSLDLAQAPAPQAAAAGSGGGAAAPAAAAPRRRATRSRWRCWREVRKAIGGDAKIARSRRSSFEGTYRRVMGEQDMNGDLELYFALPDKFQRVEQFSLRPEPPGPRIAQTLNGTEGWMGPLGPMPGGAVFRFGGPGGPAAAPAARAVPAARAAGRPQRFDPTVLREAASTGARRWRCSPARRPRPA